MADPYSIEELIAEHQQTLSFSWLSHTRPDQMPSTPTMAYWIGEYTPKHYHAIEIIHHDNLSLFKQSLEQDAFYLAAELATARPSLIILTESLASDSDMEAATQKHGIAALQTPLPTRQVLRELAYTLAEHSSHETRHGVMLSIYGQGIFLTGKSGIGKSAIALELVSRGHRLVADDAPLFHLISASAQVYALCPPLLADFLEVRALGVLNICKLFGSRASQALMPVHLVIELVETFTPEPQQRLQAYSGRTNILGMDIPHLQVPVGHSANLALIIETLTKNHVLYKKGYDANAILTQRQQLLLNKQTV